MSTPAHLSENRPEQLPPPPPVQLPVSTGLERSKSQPGLDFPPPPTAEELGGGYQSDCAEEGEGGSPKPATLHRKLSMSKPTNLDDLLRQQQEEERKELEAFAKTTIPTGLAIQTIFSSFLFQL